MSAKPLVNALFRALDERRALCYLPLETKGAVFHQLVERFPGLDWYAFVDALVVIQSVRRAAYELADNARDHHQPSASVARDLAARFPDLDRDILARAVADGFFESR